jgi:hypothetical protein
VILCFIDCLFLGLISLSIYCFIPSLLQIILETRFKNGREWTCKITGDGTDCAMLEPRPWESSLNMQLYSAKLN